MPGPTPRLLDSGVSVTVWPKILKEMCTKKNIFVLE